MPRIAIGLGVALILVGVIGYAATQFASWTALIPAILGVLFVALGWLALNPDYRKHAMHAAAVLGVVAILGTARGMIAMFRYIGGADVERPPAAIAQGITAILAIIFVILCIKSFIDARRIREA